jgi:tetratricopeptide (TPR) repeat protein
MGPHNGRAETVGLGYNGVVRHDEPLSIDSHTIVSILGVPVDILHTEAVGIQGGRAKRQSASDKQGQKSACARSVRGSRAGLPSHSFQSSALYRDITLHYLAEARVSLGQFHAAVAALKQRLDRNPNAQTSLALLANCYGHLGRIAEARAAWAEVMRIAPSFSIEWQRHVLPYKNPGDFERRVEGLRKVNISV